MAGAGGGRHGETPVQQQRRVWDEAAPSYDRQMALFERMLLSDGRAWVGRHARGRVLEVAVGTGLSLPHYPADVTLTGVEVSPRMLALARQRAADLGRDVDLREGDAEHLPFGDGAFDTVVCALGLCTIPDPGRAIAEMRRVLVPGGRLVLLDHVGSTWPPVHALLWLIEQVTVRRAGEHYTRRQQPLVRAAGFEILEAERSKAGVVERLVAQKPAAIRQVPGAG